MSHYIPVFTGAIECSLAVGREFSSDEALLLVPPDVWISTSRNWWYQDLVSTVLDTFSGFEELRYLTKTAAVVPNDQLLATSTALSDLVKAIKGNAEAFLPLQVETGSAEEVRQSIGEAKVSRNFDDDCRFALGNFFSFLASQAAALEEARQLGKCLLYVQPRP